MEFAFSTWSVAIKNGIIWEAHYRVGVINYWFEKKTNPARCWYQLEESDKHFEKREIRRYKLKTELFRGSLIDAPCYF